MENMNRQGKSPKQIRDSQNFISLSIMGIIVLLFALLLTSCDVTYHLTDAEYSDVRESHASVTYHNNSIYWGWDSGYYYYYGTPHYYPWYYYYNICPPSHYTHTTHVVITRPVNRPTHRPNIRVKTNTHRSTNVKTNVNRNKVIIKTNRSNNSNKRSVKTNRKPR